MSRCFISQLEKFELAEKQSSEILVARSEHLVPMANWKLEFFKLWIYTKRLILKLHSKKKLAQFLPVNEKEEYGEKNTLFSSLEFSAYSIHLHAMTYFDHTKTRDNNTTKYVWNLMQNQLCISLITISDQLNF